MTRQEIEQKMDELAREYHETRDPEIPEEIYELARRLRRDGAITRVFSNGFLTFPWVARDRAD